MSLIARINYFITTQNFEIFTYVEHWHSVQPKYKTFSEFSISFKEFFNDKENLKNNYLSQYFEEDEEDIDRRDYEDNKLIRVLEEFFPILKCIPSGMDSTELRDGLISIVLHWLYSEDNII